VNTQSIDATNGQYKYPAAGQTTKTKETIIAAGHTWTFARRDFQPGESLGERVVSCGKLIFGDK
jgi:hypothetical protein